MSEEEERVCRRSPLRAVETSTPRSAWILVIKKLFPPTNATDILSSRFPYLTRLMEKVSLRLPANRWIAINKPVKDKIAHLAIMPLPSCSDSPRPVTRELFRVTTAGRVLYRSRDERSG